MNIKNFTKSQEFYIIRSYTLKKHSIQKIAISLKVSNTPINRILRQKGVKIRSRNFLTSERAKKMSKHYKCDVSFFSKRSLNSAYWAGFIAADGSICERDLSLKIGLNIKDINHLIKFKKDLKFDGKIRKYCYKNSYKGNIYLNKSAIIEIYEEQIVKDLNNIYSITPRKSLTLKPPKNLTINRSLAFIAGYLDGDGSIRIPSNKSGATISFLGTFKMMQWIKETLQLLEIYTSNIYIHKSIFSLCLTQRESIAKFKKIIVAFNLPILQRKWKKLNKLKYKRNSK